MTQQRETDTDKFLKIHFPQIKKHWLRRVNVKLEKLVSDPSNGGNVELCTRFKNGEPVWNNWDERELLTHEK